MQNIIVQVHRKKSKTGYATKWVYKRLTKNTDIILFFKRKE